MLRALTIVDIIAQLAQDGSSEVPYDPNEVINALVADPEGLIVTQTSITATTTTNYPIAIVEDAGPIAYWRMDDSLSPTTVYDSSPFATATWPKHPGTPHGGLTWQSTGAMTGSKSVAFNGSSGYINTTTTSALERVNDLTLECWLYITSFADWRPIISKGVSGEYHLQVETDGSVTFRQTSYTQAVAAAGSITLNTWYHLVVVRQAIGKTINAYVNGVNTYSGTYSTTPSVTTNDVRIGAVSPTTVHWMLGSLDEVAIYARPLTATQVAHHYAWGTAVDVGSTPWDAASYGLAQYPLPASPTGAVYDDPTTVYGTAVYA